MDLFLPPKPWTDRSDAEKRLCIWLVNILGFILALEYAELASALRTQSDYENLAPILVTQARENLKQLSELVTRVQNMVDIDMCHQIPKHERQVICSLIIEPAQAMKIDPLLVLDIIGPYAKDVVEGQYALTHTDADANTGPVGPADERVFYRGSVLLCLPYQPQRQFCRTPRVAKHLHPGLEEHLAGQIMDFRKLIKRISPNPEVLHLLAAALMKVHKSWFERPGTLAAIGNRKGRNPRRYDLWKACFLESNPELSLDLGWLRVGR